MRRFLACLLAVLAVGACIVVPATRAQPPTVQLTPDPLPDADWIDFRGFAVDPAGVLVVYVADLAAADAHQIYSVPIGGGEPTEVGNPSAIGNIDGFEITGDGARVVYLTTSPAFLHSSSIEGGGNVQVSDRPVVSACWEPSADGSRVAYVGWETTFRFVFSAPTIGGSSMIIGGHPNDSGQGAACPLVASPVGNWLAYGNFTSGLYPWTMHITSFTGQSNGSFGPDLGFDEEDFVFSADGTWIAVSGGEFDIYSRDLVNLEGQILGAFYPDPVKVTPSRLLGDYYVVYTDQLSSSISSAPISFDETPLALAEGSSPTISFDGEWVVYRSGADMFRVPTLGGASRRLNGPLVPGGYVKKWLISSDSQRVVYAADQNEDELVELFSVAIGGGAAERISTDLPSWADVDGFRISSDSATVVYRADLVEDERFELFSVPIHGGESLKISSDIECPGCSVRAVRDDMSITPDDGYVLFRTGSVGDPDPAEVLFSVELDTDGDGDGALDSGDCDSGDAQVWSLPGAVADLSLAPSPGLPEVTVLTWTPPADLGGESVHYEVLRTETASGFATPGGISCILTGGTSPTAEDPDVPAGAFFYLARAVNSCGNGFIGENRAGADLLVCR